MLEVDTCVNHTEDNTRAIVLLAETEGNGIGRLGERIIDIGCLTCLVGERTHQHRHVDALHVAKTCNFLNFFYRDKGSVESVIEAALNLNSFAFQFLDIGSVFHANECRNVNTSIDSVRCGIDTIIILAGANTLANEIKAELLLGYSMAFHFERSIAFVNEHFC